MNQNRSLKNNLNRKTSSKEKAKLTKEDIIDKFL